MLGACHPIRTRPFIARPALFAAVACVSERVQCGIFEWPQRKPSAVSAGDLLGRQRFSGPPSGFIVESGEGGEQAERH